MDTDVAAVKADPAALTAKLEAELTGINARLRKIEENQADLLVAKTAGEAGLHTTLKIGGGLLALAGVAAAIWAAFKP